MKNFTKLILFFCTLFQVSSFANNVILNKPFSENDPRYPYIDALLSSILAATPELGKTTVTRSAISMTRSRTLLELRKGIHITVMAEVAQPSWDENLLAIPIPIRKGILGFRIFMIHQDNKEKMQAIKTLDDLKLLTTGSGAQWVVTAPLKQAGFSVETGSHYDGLFGMLSKGRFQTFSRGIGEAYKEINLQKKNYSDLMVDENVLLRIPLVAFFYVSPKYPKLAERIKIGLLRLIKNNTFDDLFYKYHCKDILQANLAGREVFDIPNKMISQDQGRFLVPHEFMLNPKQNFSEVCKQ